MTPDKKTTRAPYWKKLRVLGLVFLIAGIVLFIVNRQSDGFGPVLTVAGIVVLSASFGFWSSSRHAGRDR